MKAGEIFNVFANPQLNKDSFTFSEVGEYPYFTRTVLNNGIAGYVDYLNDENKIEGGCLAVGMLGMQFFYMEKDFYAGQFTKHVRPKSDKIASKDFDYRVAQYFCVLLNRYQSVFQGNLVRDFEKTFKNANLLIPIKNDCIYTKYMIQYIEQLERERIEQLEAYLVATGLKDYILTPNEEDIIKQMSIKSGGVEYKPVYIKDLFDNIEQGSRLTKAEQIKGNLAFVMSGTTNRGVIGSISEKQTKTFPATSLTIDIFGNVFYRNHEFGVSDDVGVFWSDSNEEYNKEILLYISSSLQKALLEKFSYGYKLRASRSGDLQCYLPIKNNQPDYELMEVFIRAIQKLVIKDLVEYTEKKLSAYRQVTKL